MRISQLTAFELKRLFIHRLPYIFVLLIWVLGSLWWNWIPEQTEDYDSALKRIQQNQTLALSLADYGSDFQQYELYDPGFSSPAGYPLRDENGNLIPENISFMKDFIDAHYDARQAGLTAPYGPFSIETIISEIQWRSFGPFLFMWAILAVLTFSVDYRDGRYRDLISKGVTRSQILASKIITAALAALIFAGLWTLMMAYFGHGAYAGLKDVVAPSFGSIVATSFIFNIIWLSAWFFFIYFILGGLVSLFAFRVTGSYDWAMVSAVAVLGFALGVTLNISPCDTIGYGFLNNLAPVTLGYNFNSLHQAFWLHSENLACYRNPWSAALIALLFTGLIYTGLSFIFKRGRLSKERSTGA